MKRSFSTFWAMLLVAFMFAGCEKNEIVVPDTQSELQAKRSGGTQTSTTTYGGRATGLDATVWNFQSPTVTSTQTTFADSYFLPATGGSITKSELQATISGVLTANTLQASITGQNNGTQSQASVSDIAITTGGNTISATNLKATATAGCGGVVSGSSQLTNLIVNGQTITVTGVANQTIYLANGGFIIINEKSTSKKGTPSVQVSALHIVIPNVSDIRVACAKADIKC